MCLEFSKDNRFLASGGYDEFIYVWSLRDMTLVNKIKTMGPVYDV